MGTLSWGQKSLIVKKVNYKVKSAMKVTTTATTTATITIIIINYYYFTS